MKWWWSLVIQMIDICAVNIWRAYQIANPDEKSSLLDVEWRLVILYRSKENRINVEPSRTSRKLTEGKTISTDMQLDPGNHSSSCHLKHNRDVRTVRNK
ncbi:hypothetical protein TNCT_595051 [Trichonephila clavata]|uniref:Uncharacterized protein n=1 Tax=Trichonephila clavata TaxID=2740835 RepID=A0A8X6FGA5_TRICU|nr:hypothetical protein TNCT_595051 [Trichonephila clavata]